MTGPVEVDECFVGGLEHGLRGGRQRGTKALVVVAVEIRDAGSGRLRMQVINDASADTLCGFVQDAVAPGASIHTDGWPSYRRLTKLGYQHHPRTQRPGRIAVEDLDDILPRVHRAISNLKSWLQGTHKGVSAEHLQVYLDEFVFRFNRRRTPMAAFQTLLGLGSQPAVRDLRRDLHRQSPARTGTRSLKLRAQNQRREPDKYDAASSPGGESLGFERVHGLETGSPGSSRRAGPMRRQHGGGDVLDRVLRAHGAALDLWSGGRSGKRPRSMASQQDAARRRRIAPVLP